MLPRLVPSGDTLSPALQPLSQVPAIWMNTSEAAVDPLTRSSDLS